MPKITNTPTTQHTKNKHLDKQFLTKLTDTLLHTFYPKTCCFEPLTAIDGKRDQILRCKKCHRQQSILKDTPLEGMRSPRWMFGYIWHESVVQYPKVLTAAEIQRRLGVTYKTAWALKKRLQLICIDILPRMEQKFYLDQKIQNLDFNFPKSREEDLTEIVAQKKIPQVDTVVLYSTSTATQKGRKQHRKGGMTSSIYVKESLGGHQRGILVNTLGVRNGPVFYNSVPDQKAETLYPVINRLIPFHNPVFGDMGYKWYAGKNLRLVNHSLRSKDKRYRWNRNRWSKNGVHVQVAEGNQSKLKKAFSSYRWVDPRYSNMYLGEYTVIGNLRYFDLEDLVPGPKQRYRIDDTYELNKAKALGRGQLGKLQKKGPSAPVRGKGMGIIPRKLSLQDRLKKDLYDAKSLVEIKKESSISKERKINEMIEEITNPGLRARLRQESSHYADWYKERRDHEQRSKQRYYETLAEQLWSLLSTDSYIEIHELADSLEIPARFLFRIIGRWTEIGLIETIHLNRGNPSDKLEFYDIKKRALPLIPLLYVLSRSQLTDFHLRWKAKTIAPEEL